MPDGAYVATEIILTQARWLGLVWVCSAASPLNGLCTGDLLQAFHAALQNAPGNPKNPAAKGALNVFTAHSLGDVAVAPSWRNGIAAEGSAWGLSPHRGGGFARHLPCRLAWRYLSLPPQERAQEVVLRVLTSFKGSEIEPAVNSLDSNGIDLLMKYIYKGFEKPTENSSAILLQWHEKVREVF
ncbi:hypothetical protein lerEdw1_015940 [Lerista edwardsae]|nr:hypothetical protein lerEdw1_015940 [Lerista edwardsae]